MGIYNMDYLVSRVEAQCSLEGRVYRGPFYIYIPLYFLYDLIKNSIDLS
jgi:hypothetical protein